MTRPRDQVDTDEDLFDSRKAKNYFDYVRGSLRRRAVLAAGVFFFVLFAAAGALLVFPKSYHVESKLLAQRSAGLSVRGDANGADAPTRAASQIVLRHENLVAMAQATDLVRHYSAHLALSQRVRAAIGVLLQPPLTDDDRLEAVVDLLSTQFNV